ncbi:hypothetical protein NY98_02540 [Xanthomonas citri pv. fuscans]|uniref:Uncharacterized protein n=1 Tax=Xanthomonas citri pv. fuscans TaxID=366649 RepID=A0AB34QBW4_XANCI|nr:hypothetical protein [Xanthomonas citri]KGU55898.1 hypothetical protein NY98_02540 [Xanthomonas citri pv. fuscans]
MSIFDADDLVSSALAPVITIRPEIRTMNRPKKTRYIPANAEAREFPQAGVVAYCYGSGVRYALLAYKGRQIRAALNLAFTTAEQRDRHLTSYIERQAANENAKRERRETGHGLAVGDIVYETYGYEQTNVHFYEVTRVPSARSAVVCEIEAEKTEAGEKTMAGTAVPRPGVFKAGAMPRMHRAAYLHALSGGPGHHGSLSKWDGRPKYYSSYY